MNNNVNHIEKYKIRQRWKGEWRKQLKAFFLYNTLQGLMAAQMFDGACSHQVRFCYDFSRTRNS